MPEPLMIRGRPSRSTAMALLQLGGLPESDLTDAHLEHFFFSGTDGSPTALMGLEIYGIGARSTRGALCDVARCECHPSFNDDGGSFLRALGISARRSHSSAAVDQIHARVRKPVSGELIVHVQEALPHRRNMKRIHVHVSVKDLSASLRFYRELFEAEPIVVKTDYAKWMLDDPRVNFSISQRSKVTGVDHLGIQVEDHAELTEVYSRLKRAEGPVLEVGATTCCYAKSEKSWISDPQGVEWETFLTSGESTTYGTDSVGAMAAKPCCAPNGTP